MTFEFGSDENIKTLGEYLRRKRESKDLSLEDVATHIKIHAKYLGALEEGRDQDLPDAVYKELFLKAYSDYLGVSLDELLLRLPEHQPSATAEEESKQSESTKPPVKAPAVATPVQAPLPETPRRKGGRPVLYFLIGVVAIFVGLYGLKYYRDNFMKTEDSAPAGVSPAVQETVIPDSLPLDTVQVATEPAMLNLLMIGKGECWIEVSIDGDSIFSEILKAPDTLWFAMQDSISCKFGRANMVEVWCNAKPLALVTPEDGSVKTFTITRDNYDTFVDTLRLAP